MKFSGWRFLLFCYVLLMSLMCVNGNLYDPCISLTTCGECIRVPNCAWCAKTMVVQSNATRCQLRDNMNDTCPIEFIFAPIPEYKIITDIPVTRAIRKPEATTLRPQRAALTNLRLGEAYNISLQFKVVENYPADLYYLMDVSNSMLDDKNNLVKLTSSLVETMKNLTDDFKLGFGSFIDKNVFPFVDTTGSSCGSPDMGCGVTYSFQNRLPLSDKTDEFTNVVKLTEILRTYDTPEGGFDALLQSMVCKEQIGWRERARRLLVFVTDAHSHLAGNGRLGGVVRPNDGKCHLDEIGMYQEATNQDYPSVGQISRFAKDNAINLIFAVTQNVVPTYKEFSYFISGSSVGVLDQDSANIVGLIRDTYEKIASSVEMKDTATDGVKLRYYTACKGTLVQEKNKCENLKIGDVVNFTISIEATECPTSATGPKQIFTIYPVGVTEVLTMELETTCDCPCEKPGNPGFVANATQCNFGGDFECGVCDCDDQHSGQNCECSADDNIADLESQCKPDNTTTNLCSNHGDCVCGKCECRQSPNPTEVISGKYCECDNFSCDRVDGILCSGNGVCNCKKCSCFAGWEGNACDCKTTTESCIPLGGETCSGNGNCKCGKCECKPEAQGVYCEDCPSCPSRCDEFTPCVQCKVFETGPYMANDQANCNKECTYPIEIEDTVQVEQTSERDCSYENEQKCVVKFVYGFDSDGGRRVRVKREPDCPDPVPVLALGLGLLGALVLAGLILLLFFRISTYLYDKREYARFLNERENAKWSRDNNPIYVDPTQTFKNPAYNS